MKKYFFAFIFLFTNIFGFSQDAESPDYKWKFGVEITTPRRDLPSEFTYVNAMQSAFSNFQEYNLVGGVEGSAKTKDKTVSIGLFGSYYLKCNNFARIRVEMNKVNVGIPVEEYSDTVQHYYYSASKKRSDFIEAIGIGHFIKVKKTIFHVGFEIPLTIYGQEKLHDYYEVDNVKTGVFIYSGETTASFANGYSVGIGSFAGFSFLLKNFSIGSEMSSAFLLSKYGGKGVYEHVNKDASQNPTYINLTHSPNISIFEFSKIKINISLTYTF